MIVVIGNGELTTMISLLFSHSRMDCFVMDSLNISLLNDLLNNASVIINTLIETDDESWMHIINTQLPHYLSSWGIPMIHLTFHDDLYLGNVSRTYTADSRPDALWKSWYHTTRILGEPFGKHVLVLRAHVIEDDFPLPFSNVHHNGITNFAIASFIHDKLTENYSKSLFGKTIYIGSEQSQTMWDTAAYMANRQKIPIPQYQYAKWEMNKIIRGHLQLKNIQTLLDEQAEFRNWK